MSYWLRREDYEKANTGGVTKPHRASHGGVRSGAPKARLPVSMRTKPCTFCDYPAVKTVKLGFKKIETRRLCKYHLAEYEQQEKEHAVLFRRASDIMKDPD